MSDKFGHLSRWRRFPSWAIVLIGIQFFGAIFFHPSLIHAQMPVTRTVIFGSGPTNFLPATAPAPRLLVKFKAKMALQIEDCLALPALKSQSAASGIQAWLNQYQLPALRPLCPQRLEQKIRYGFTEAEMARMTRDRFPLRAQRISGDFNPPDILRTYILDVTNRSRLELRAVAEQCSSQGPPPA